MKKEMIALLQENNNLLAANNKLLQEISQKLSAQPTLLSIPVAESRSSVGQAFGLPSELVKIWAEQYQENPDIVIQEDAKLVVRDGNVFFTSKAGRVNTNTRENSGAQSSFIKSIAQRGQTLVVKFKKGNTYTYTCSDRQEFERVADVLLTSTYVSRPFLTHLKQNKAFSYTSN